MVGAELPSNSDQIIWAEQGRLHLKYLGCTSAAAAASNTAVWTVPTASNPGATTLALRVGQTVLIQRDADGVGNRAIITAVTQGGGAVGTFTVAYYETGGQVMAAAQASTVFVYGSEFAKGTGSMVGSLEAESSIFTNKPIILKDTYAVNGSDMAQIGWVEVTTENGATGYLWYLKSEHETRLRFEDYLETAMVEAVNAGAGSGALAAGFRGSEGVFAAVGSRGNIWGAGLPNTLTDWDAIVTRLDRQGAIEENALFVNRAMSFEIDNFLATINGLNGTLANPANAASFGLFDNDVNMALNLGFSGFRRGYDFYKTDWKYLNDPTMRGGLSATAASATTTVNGLLVPAGSTTVYDQILGKNAKRPFLHVRYRASEAEDRRYKTWITGSAGGASTNDIDAMQVNFLSERCVCTLGANNFVLFRFGAA